ncbi:hypothetical protein [Frankia sp. Cas4]|uniref:hypothetical protein n=1 Tax=Frankia sp. Cas4 TaxID=3073927 RepID=UPI002AD31B39|nr:hypothetical protein [Frankia sp. Cas4]
MAIQTYTKGDPRQAASLVQVAIDSVHHDATPRLQAALHARLARALAKAADGPGSARALLAAQHAIDCGPHDDDPPWTYWVTPGEIHMLAASCALDLAEPHRAIDHFHDAVTAYDGTLSPRDHAIFLARSADAHLALGDLDAACADATAAVDRLHGVDSDRSTATVADIRRKLARHHNSLAVRDFLTRTA